MRNSYKYNPSFYRRHWFIGSLIALFIVSAVAGGVTYGFHLHLTAKAAELDLSQLNEMEDASTIFDRTGATFGYIYEERRERVPLAQMSVDLQHAVVSAEDNRFYTHSGSDPRGILRAAYQNLRGSRVRQGGSTITQQLARNTFPLGGRTFSRKILEIYVARRIETALTKDQIMEYYLNRIYLGSGLYGVEAASKGYFGKRASELSLGEAATLAGLINSPNNKSPWHDKRAAKNARDTVLSRMLDEQYITREQYQTAQEEELSVKPRVLASSDSYALEAVRQQVIAQVGLDRAVSEGLKIYTTIDARVQQQAEAALRAQLDEVERNPAFQNHQTYAQYETQFHDEEKKIAQQAPAADADAQQPSIHSVVANPEYLQGALIALNNADGGVIALVGGRDFKHSEFNRAMHPRARRPVGTAFTPLVYAAAYQKGIFPGRLFLDQVLDNRQVMVGGQNGILGEWGVERAGNRYDGPIPAGLALVEGKNAATVRVGNETGLDNVLALAKRAGINSPLREFPATFLGSSEVTLSELALAYTGFPNGGWRPAAPYLLSEIKDADGNVLFRAKPGPRARIVDVAPAYQVHNELAQILKSGIAATANSRYGLKSMVAGGKPGTAYNFTDALFAGYNSEVTCAVWAGFDKPSPIYRGAFGSQVALPVWVNVMNAAAQVLPPKDIPVPSGLRKVEICTESGELATDRCYETTDGERHRTTFVTYATKEEMPQRFCPVHGGGRSSIGEFAASLRGAPNAVPVSKPSTDPKAPMVAKAQAVANFDGIKPVQIKAPTVLVAGEHDPYDAVRPVQENADHRQPSTDGSTALNKSPEVSAATPAAGLEPEKKVLRATAVNPNEQDAASLPTVKIDPPQPLEFN